MLEHEREMVLYKVHEGITSGHNAKKEIAHKHSASDYGGRHYLKNLRTIIMLRRLPTDWEAIKER